MVRDDLPDIMQGVRTGRLRLILPKQRGLNDIGTWWSFDVADGVERGEDVVLDL